MTKLSFMRLWDIYGGLLTPTQREITHLYFNLDLTASEIADSKGISRQAVSDCLHGCEKQLQEFESKLGFSKWNALSCLESSIKMTNALRWAQNFKSEHGEFSGEIEKLIEIINADYSAEAEKEYELPQNAKYLK